MLSIEDIHILAERHNLKVFAHYDCMTVLGRTPPQPRRLTVCFLEENPEAWEILVTHCTEVPVSIEGTRQVTSSGSTDNLLYATYAERLSVVNLRRAAIGLSPVLR